MKILLLLLLSISMIIMMGADTLIAKEQKSILSELSNTLSSRSNGRKDKNKEINKGFEWIIQGVNILGQMDNLISDRAKDIIRKLHLAYNEDDRGPYRSRDHGLKRNY
ncbi:uncharacterized protein LOC143428959 [Xylocopa sonorina]|uniref:uncharacterized protein LOC143428959 n=1 Tax=Xylocopa sonorina TaxID=1818115 RepID=UPI00403AC8E7